MANYTNILKPTGAVYTNLAKPSGAGATIKVGMSIGLLIPLTISVAQTVGSSYTNLAKPSGTPYINLAKPT